MMLESMEMSIKSRLAKQRARERHDPKKTMLRVDGRAMTVAEVSAEVGVELTSIELRRIAAGRPLTMERIRQVLARRKK